MTRRPQLSIVLPTFNRRARLERVLRGLDRQSAPADAFELVVVDDGSSDDTQAWLREQGQRAYACRSIRQENAGPARARNRGIEAAEGDLLLFLDDDVEPTPALVAEHLRSHALEADLVVIGPLGSLPHYDQPWVAWEQAKVEAQYAAMLRGDWDPTFRQFWTGNASVGRAHVVAVGAFDTTFKRAEDVELGRRLHERGLKFRFNPEARGLHHAERSLEAWIAMHRAYGALEVKIFGGLGEGELVATLAGNLSRIHPASRWLVGQCLDRPRRHAFASAVLKRWLELSVSLKFELGSESVCGALANITYWQASAAALGAQLTDRTFRLSDELRDTRRKPRGANMPAPSPKL